MLLRHENAYSNIFVERGFKELLREDFTDEGKDNRTSACKIWILESTPVDDD